MKRPPYFFYIFLLFFSSPLHSEGIRTNKDGKWFIELSSFEFHEGNIKRNKTKSGIACGGSTVNKPPLLPPALVPQQIGYNVCALNEHAMSRNTINYTTSCIQDGQTISVVATGLQSNTTTDIRYRISYSKYPSSYISISLKKRWIGPSCK